MSNNDLNKQLIYLMTEYFILDDSPEFLDEEQERTFVQKLSKIVNQSDDKSFVEAKKMIRKYKLKKINK
jgi:hypothetical protein